MNLFQKWQKQDSSAINRMAALGVGALVFPMLIPALLIFGLPQVDRYFGIGPFFGGWMNIVIGLPAVILGGALAIWTIAVQVTLASGTPFPMLPTKKLLIVGPFKFCRNPMTLGTIVAYAGMAIWIGSLSALLSVAMFSAGLICYLKLIEEKELFLRFGAEYIEYKKKTPFIIPIKFDGRNSQK